MGFSREAFWMLFKIKIKDAPLPIGIFFVKWRGRDYLWKGSKKHEKINLLQKKAPAAASYYVVVDILIVGRVRG